MTSTNGPIVLHAAEEESAAYLAIRLASDPTFRDKAVFVAETFAATKKAFEILERWWYIQPAEGRNPKQKRPPGPRRDIDLNDFVTPAGGHLVFMGESALSRKLPYLAQVVVVIGQEGFTFDEIKFCVTAVMPSSEQSLAERFAGSRA